MTDLTEFPSTWRLLQQLLTPIPDPAAPVSPALRIELLEADVRRLTDALQEERETSKSLKSLLGIVVHFHLNAAVTLPAAQMQAHPNQTFQLQGAVHTLLGTLTLTTR